MPEKISACLLARDDAPTLEPLLEQLRPHVDELIIVDTGSTDETPRIAEKFADKFERYSGCNGPDGLIMDFADARNHALSLASNPWHFWADADDALVGPEHIRTLASQRKADNHTWLISYEYTHDAAGRCTCIHWRENLVYPLDRHKWQTPVHEVLINGSPAGSVVHERTTLVRRIHRKQLSKRAPDPDRNLRILKAYVARVGEGDVRALYYLGIEHSIRHDYSNALRVLRRYVQLSGWADEKCLAHLELARIYQEHVGDQETAIKWAQEAMLTKGWDAPYWVISRSFCMLAMQGIDAEYNFKRSAHFAQIGMSLPETETVLFVNPLERMEAYKTLAMSLANVGRLHEALEAAKTGLAKLPEDAWLQEVCPRLESIVTKNRVLSDLMRLHDLKQLDAGFMDQVRTGFERSQQLTAQPPAAEMPVPAALAQPAPAAVPAEAGCLDIAIFVGPGLEPWNPVTLVAKGMGGSETMAWEMSRRLRALGHRVRVFVQCGAELEGTFDNVEWLDWTRYKGTECDVLIASRHPVAVDDAADLKAKTRILWLHDIHAGDALTQKRALRFDAVLGLSEWHAGFLRDCYPRVDPALVRVTRNGIDPKRFASEPERNPVRVVYSSSPDRGIDTLLQVWPRILAEEPYAELHIFYGIENLCRTYELRGQGEAAARTRAVVEHVKTMPRVTYHGMVSGRELATEMLSSGVWASPEWFCCHPDTRISVPGDHRGGPPTVRIADMVGKSGFPVYAFNEEANRFEIRTCLRVWETKISDELVAIELDSGETLRVTPDHRVLTFDGDWVEAGTLAAGDSLRALHYRYNVAIRDGNGRWTNEHRLVGKWKAGRELRRDEHVDHSDPIRLDNRPESLAVMTATEHFSKTHKGKRLSKKHVARKTKSLLAAIAAKSPEERSAHARLAGMVWKEKLASMDPLDKSEMFRASSKKRAETLAARRLSDPGYAERMSEQGRINGAKGHAKRWGTPLPIEMREGHNHKVVSVTRVPGPIAVYDMEVEGLHNFVADGIVVHNCETSCITAMEAQAAGLYCVATPVAALNETVGERGTLVPGIVQDPNADQPEEFKAAFVRAVVDALRGENQPRTREELQAYAREHFGLDDLAKEWDVMLRELVERGQRGEVPRWVA